MLIWTALWYTAILGEALWRADNLPAAAVAFFRVSRRENPVISTPFAVHRPIMRPYIDIYAWIGKSCSTGMFNGGMLPPPIWISM